MDDVLPLVKGHIASVHAYMNMSFRPFKLANGTAVRTCPPAFGELQSFALRATDI